MTKSQESIIAMIDRLSTQFSALSFKYQYDHEVKQHVVDILPAKDADSDDFIDIASSEISEFLDQFPNEGVLFVSDDPYIKVENPLYTIPHPGNHNIRKRTQRRSSDNTDSSILETELGTKIYILVRTKKEFFNYKGSINNWSSIDQFDLYIDATKVAHTKQFHYESDLVLN
jgi:hypothetical protein